MSNRPSNVADPIIQAIRDGDPGLAQCRLDAAGEALPDARRRSLQARVSIASGTPEEAIRLLRTEADKRDLSPANRRMLIRAYLDAGQPQNAYATLGGAGCPPDQILSTLSDARLWTATIDAETDRATALGIVDRARALFPDDPVIAANSVAALAAQGEFGKAGTLIESMPPGPAVFHAAWTRFLATCFRAHQTAVLLKHLPAITRITGSHTNRLLRACFVVLEGPEDRAILLSILPELICGIGSNETAHYVAKLLMREGYEQEGLNLIAAFRGRTAPRDRVRQDDAPGKRGADQSFPNAEPIMDWLDVPNGQREIWLREARRGQEEHAEMGSWLAAVPGAWEVLQRSIRPADLSELRKLDAEGRAAIMATVHSGFLMGTLAHLHMQDVPVSIVGGDPVLREVLEGGDRLTPIRRDASATHTARTIIRLINENHIVGLAGDGRRGSALVPYSHRGATFRLPDSIPQLALKYRIPVVWIATYWNEAQIVCDCETGPELASCTNLDEARALWFDFMLDRIRQICLADPRNAAVLYRLFQTRD
ncbi:hypothetical protein CLV78_1093 [Aliiruegeria haliotis]|uniref:Vi polysaccharide export protein VexE n=1 Tax=Aliiruegeria haliotis TaxID=1280846 RepID=A0A2T0RJP2_9RHOB|nr:hypothetical protein [Aliiruegeria haliotis]PRY21393.1 hypothetical protein CLV78_1093 [Aliiruegeria haliotis]